MAKVNIKAEKNTSFDKKSRKGIIMNLKAIRKASKIGENIRKTYGKIEF